MSKMWRSGGNGENISAMASAEAAAAWRNEKLWRQYEGVKAKLEMKCESSNGVAWRRRESGVAAKAHRVAQRRQTWRMKENERNDRENENVDVIA
jgi:hypothetical protein